jgi:hypothetical protein
MKNEKYHTVETIPKSNIKIAERGKFDTLNTQTHEGQLSWLGTAVSIKRAGFIFLSSRNLSHFKNVLVIDKY